ncbi:MAG: hypothetical protein PHD01_18305, partial [Geobacteraceae bacterium]|nr:hypothetical protein [Geobacteraceae bacterium]
ARARRFKKAHTKKPAPFTYIRSMTKQFSRFDIGALNKDEKDKLRIELEKLMGSIAQTLETLE